MESLQIVLDHTEAKFLPGSAICGYLRVVLSSQVGINAITLGVYGKAETKFSQVQVSEDTSFASGYIFQALFFHYAQLVYFALAAQNESLDSISFSIPSSLACH